MRWMPQDRAIPAAAAVSFGTTFACLWWQTWAPLLALAPVASYVLSDTLAERFRAEFCVYLLRSEEGEALYVGSTNDVMRRALEHTSPAHHEPWRSRIHSATVLRWCHSARQAERVERRRIRALAVAAENGWCHELKNETWSAPARYPRKVWYLGWSLAYLCQSFVWAHCCWHRCPRDWSWAFVIPGQDRFGGEPWDSDPAASRSRHAERHAFVDDRHAEQVPGVTLTDEGPFRDPAGEPADEAPSRTEQPPEPLPPGEGSGQQDRPRRPAGRTAEQRARDAERAKRYRARRRGEGS